MHFPCVWKWLVIMSNTIFVRLNTSFIAMCYFRCLLMTLTEPDMATRFKVHGTRIFNYCKPQMRAVCAGLLHAEERLRVSLNSVMTRVVQRWLLPLSCRERGATCVVRPRTVRHLCCRTLLLEPSKSRFPFQYGTLNGVPDHETRETNHIRILPSKHAAFVYFYFYYSGTV